MRHRLPLIGLFAALMALMVHLALGAMVPRMPALAQVLSAQVLCHSDDGGTAPDQQPNHLLDCLLCPLCIAAHASVVAVLPSPPDLPLIHVMPVRLAGLPPPSRAPPVAWHPPQQPRAPPAA
jgi:hypothetical protein